MNAFYYQILALFLTISIEFVVYWLFIKKDMQRLLLYSVLINCFTHPVASFFFQGTITSFLLIEIVVFIVESFLLMWLLEIKIQKSLVISLVANLITAMLSIIFLIAI